jgi:hypothetical protein
MILTSVHQSTELDADAAGSCRPTAGAGGDRSGPGEAAERRLAGLHPAVFIVLPDIAKLIVVVVASAGWRTGPSNE